MSKRKYQKTNKIYMEGRKGLRQMSMFFSLFSFLLTFWAKVEYSNNPHHWYDMEIDILLLGCAFVFALVNTYIKSAVLFFQLYLQKGNVKWTMLSILLPFIPIVYSLFTKPALYILPLVVIVIVHFVNHVKSNATTKAPSKRVTA